MTQRLERPGAGEMYSLQMRTQQQSVFNEREIRSIIAQTLLGLGAMHKAGFFHRDIKPENLLTRGDVVKVADYGLAKEIRARPPYSDYVSTRWFRAPEILLHGPYNSPVDIWAVGVVFGELFLNRPLFPGTSETDQLFRICVVLGAPSTQDWEEGHQLAKRMNMRLPTVVATGLRNLLPMAPPDAIDLMEQMLQFNPANRPSASQCLRHPFLSGTCQGIESGRLHSPFRDVEAAAAAAALQGAKDLACQGDSGIQSSGGSVREMCRTEKNLPGPHPIQGGGGTLHGRLKSTRLKGGSLLAPQMAPQRPRKNFGEVELSVVPEDREIDITNQNEVSLNGLSPIKKDDREPKEFWF